MAKIAHFMIRVLELDRSRAFYAHAFDLHEIDAIEFDDFSLHYLKNAESGTELELTVNHTQSGPYELGNGYGHMAVVVDDLEATRERCVAAGSEPGDIVDFVHEGVQIARFFFTQDPDGYDIEVLQRFGRFQ